MKIRLWINVILIIALMTGGAGIALGNSSDDDVNFTWAFIHKKPGEPYGRILDFKQKPKVSSGDKLQIVLNLTSQSYIYLYLLSSSNELDLVFPDSLSFYTENKADAEFYLPGKTEWFSVDDTKGTEKFFLLASSTRLVELEQQTEDYLVSGKNPEKKATLIASIKKLRKSYSKLASIAEKGVPIAGTFRTRGHGDISVVLGDAVEVKTEKFYGKTIRLKHE